MKERFNSSNYFVDRHIEEGRGENIAIECGDVKITYRELSEKINRVGNGLLQLGIKKGERMLIMLPDIPEFFISFFAALKIGAVPVPVNTLLAAADYQYLFADSEVKAVVESDALVEKIKDISVQVQVIVVGQTSSPSETSFVDMLAKNSPNFVDNGIDASGGFFWYYSSGSTGAPKACVHRERDMALNAESYGRDVLGITPKDKCLSVSKLFFTYGLGNSLYCPLAAGATVILMPDAPKPDIIFDTIERHRPTLFFSVPSNYARLLDHADKKDQAPDLSSIRAFISAGEPLPISLAKRFKEKFGGAEILDTIGATECLIFIANRPDAMRPGASGQLIPGCEAKILDDDNNPVPPGTVGNLFIKSDSMCREYWRQPEKTKRAIQNGWFRTGDRFWKDADGYFWCDGRADDMIKSNAAWVNPLEVEKQLAEHPSVLEAAVVGRKDDDELMKPMAYIVLREGFSASSETKTDIEAFLKTRLPNYKQPRWIEFVAELPRTATGKLQRFKLRRS